MISDPLNLALVNDTQTALGIDAEYHSAGGVVTDVKVVPEFTIDELPGNFDSAVTEQEQTFLLRAADVTGIQRDDVLVFDNERYTIQTIEPLDGEQVRVTLK